MFPHWFFFQAVLANHKGTFLERKWWFFSLWIWNNLFTKWKTKKSMEWGGNPELPFLCVLMSAPHSDLKMPLLAFSFCTWILSFRSSSMVMPICATPQLSGSKEGTCLPGAVVPSGWLDQRWVMMETLLPLLWLEQDCSHHKRICLRLEDLRLQPNYSLSKSLILWVENATASNVENIWANLYSERFLPTTVHSFIWPGATSCPWHESTFLLSSKKNCSNTSLLSPLGVICWVRNQNVRILEVINLILVLN